MGTATATALGLRTLPSQANFVWIDMQRDAGAVQRNLAEQGIMIRGVWGRWSDPVAGLDGAAGRRGALLPRLSCCRAGLRRLTAPQPVR